MIFKRKAPPSNRFKETFAIGREELDVFSRSAAPEPLSSVELGIIWAIALWSNEGTTDQDRLRPSAQMVFMGYAAGHHVRFQLDDKELVMQTDAMNKQLVQTRAWGMPDEMASLVIRAVVRGGNLDGILDSAGAREIDNMRNHAIDKATSQMDESLAGMAASVMESEFNAGVALCNMFQLAASE